MTTLGTITVEVGNKREIAKTLTEEDVTSAMMRAIKTGDRKICYVLGSGESSTENAEGAGFARSAAKRLHCTARSSKWRVTTRCTTCCIGVTSSGRDASIRRSAIGADKTHWRTGICGMPGSSPRQTAGSAGPRQP